VPLARLQELLLLLCAEAAVATPSRGGLADVGDGEEVGEEGQFQSDGARGLAGDQPFVTVFGNQVGGDCRETVGS